MPHAGPGERIEDLRKIISSRIVDLTKDSAIVEPRGGPLSRKFDLARRIERGGRFPSAHSFEGCRETSQECEGNQKDD